jgi:glutamine cyclotransferase
MDEKFGLNRKLQVTMNGRPLKNLNELEWINGKIWANVYLTDTIVIINPSNGKVEGSLDCTGLLPDELWTSATDVLNGIAVDADGKIYVTGKNWPKLYQIELVK